MMARDEVVRSIFELSIDNAFIRHIEKLFESFASDLEHELKVPNEERLSSRLPSARKRFEGRFEVAVKTHYQMIDHYRKKYADA